MSHSFTYDKKYCYPGTETLINKLGIQDAALLDDMERKLTAVRLAELKVNPLKGNFDYEHLKAIHKFIFQDLYNWAGQQRTVVISKGLTFAYPEYIDEQAKYIFKQLKNDNNLKGMDKDLFCEKLAYYKAEINMLHPFREGNGRSTREFIECLANHNGYTIDFSIISKQKYMEAMISSPSNTKQLTELFRSSVRYLDPRDIHKNIINQYENQCPAVKHISIQAAKALDDINFRQGSPLSLQNIRELYAAAGKEYEITPTPDKLKSFNELKLIIDDLKHAQLSYLNENAKVKTIDKSFVKSMDHEISG